MPHNGLSLSAPSATGAGGETTTCAGTAGFVLADDGGDPACTPSAQSASNRSLETADVNADAPRTDSAKNMMPIASFRIILRPAIAPTPPAESAISPHRTRPPGPEPRTDLLTKTAFRLRDHKAAAAVRADRFRSSRPC